MLRLAFSVMLLLAFSREGTAEETPPTGLVEPTGRMPFQVVRSRLILPVRIGDSEPLNVILDTGMGFDGVYLFHRELIEELDSADVVEVRVPGAGAGEPSTAVMVDSMTVSCGDMVFDGQRVIVSTSETTQGFPTDGIIGWTMLGHHVAVLDYDDHEVALFERGRYVPDSSWQRVDLS